ncbi:MAG: argininosuccinate lyase [Acidobacteria bacterium]|nr:argininosuccinate lyase [Acidobacteriota bacterium]
MTNDNKTDGSSQLWGGRFTGKPDERFAEFNRSFGFDIRLFEADIRCSIAHANGLAGAGVLSPEEADSVTGALRTMLELAANDPDYMLLDVEDVHSFIETRLIEFVGDLGKKVHTGRSRNDQVATAFRLWMRDETDALIGKVGNVLSALVSLAERHKSAVIPGYTHLQRAQPVLWTHWCLAYFEMLSRDIERLADARKRINVMPLGSAALAGTAYTIDREAVAHELGFEDVSRNSLDAVSDRDFAVEFASACSLVMVHLSRLAEDLILYCSQEFGFVKLGDAVSTGSSLMPQKKNPDALELLRGKAGRVFGHQMALLTMMKGLPLAYNKDMQEDKEAIFDTADTVAVCLDVAAITLNNVTLNEQKAREAAAKGYLNATELADYLVRKNVPFRTAHDAVGRLVLAGLEKGKELNELSVSEMQAVVPEINEGVYEALSIESTLRSKSATGGTSPVRVAEALAEARARIEE